MYSSISTTQNDRIKASTIVKLILDQPLANVLSTSIAEIGSVD